MRFKNHSEEIIIVARKKFLYNWTLLTPIIDFIVPRGNYKSQIGSFYIIGTLLIRS